MANPRVFTSFEDFFTTGDKSIQTDFIAKAKKVMEEKTVDRLANVLADKSKFNIEIPEFQFLPDDFLGVFKRSNLDNTQNSLDQKTQHEIQIFLEDLFKFASRDLLDEKGNLKEIIKQKFGIKENEAQYRDKLLKAFVLEMFMEVCATPKVSQEFKEQADKTMSMQQNAHAETAKPIGGIIFIFVNNEINRNETLLKNAIEAHKASPAPILKIKVSPKNTQVGEGSSALFGNTSPRTPSSPQQAASPKSLGSAQSPGSPISPLTSIKKLGS